MGDDPSTPLLLGRLSDVAALDALTAAARGGTAGSLLLTGEPGVGKTALLDHISKVSGDFAVTRITGVECEMDLGFGALHRLLVPFLDRIRTLPGPQGLALSAAFGLAEGSAPARYLVALAALTVLTDSARGQPVLCIIDDAQWVDVDSMWVLGFICRRLLADRLALVISVRDGSPDTVALLRGVDCRRIGGLDADGGVALLRSVTSGPLHRGTALRVVEQLGGNPLAIIQLAAELSSEQLSGRAVLPEELPLGRRLQDHYQRRVQALPADTRRFLLVMACDTTGEPGLLAGASADLGLPVDAVGPAVDADLVDAAGAAFRHPMIRSALLGGTSHHERCAVHLALAAVLDSDPDRQVWHRAAASRSPDEPVAEELDLAAGRARRRGEHRAAARFLRRAAELSGTAAARGRRVVATARELWIAGDPRQALWLLRHSDPEVTAGLDRAEMLRIRGLSEMALGRATVAQPLLLEAAMALSAHDPSLSRSTLIEALQAATNAGRLMPVHAVSDVARAMRSVADPGAAPSPGDSMLQAVVTLLLDGHAAAAPIYRRAVVSLETGAATSDELLQWLPIACWCAGAFADDHTLHLLAMRLQQHARAEGAMTALTFGTFFAGVAELVAGRLDAARQHFGEIATLIVEPNVDGPSLVGALVAAWSGDEATTLRLARSVRDGARARGEGWIVSYVDHLLMVLRVGNGSYAEAMAELSDGIDSFEFLVTMAIPDQVEAAVRVGELDLAHVLVARLAPRATASGTPLAVGLLDRCRGLIAGDDSAEDWFRSSLGRLEQARGPAALARTRLVYGEWLRRRGRRVDARAELRAAFGSFSDSGMLAFAERARAELLATGAHARRRDRTSPDLLTPQESQVAALAADGNTNREIATRLFISASTVEYHLGKVYRKLGVSSRRALRAALADPATRPADAPGRCRPGCCRPGCCRPGRRAPDAGHVRHRSDAAVGHRCGSGRAGDAEQTARSGPVVPIGAQERGART